MTKLHADLEALMPEPAFELTWRGDLARYFVSKPNIGNTAVFTADQVREAMQAATERAARICDGLVYALDNGGNRYRREADASKCAAAIRAASMHDGEGKES